MVNHEIASWFTMNSLEEFGNTKESEENHAVILFEQVHTYSLNLCFPNEKLLTFTV